MAGLYFIIHLLHQSYILHIVLFIKLTNDYINATKSTLRNQLKGFTQNIYNPLQADSPLNRQSIKWL